MRYTVRHRFWTELALGIASAVATIVTLVAKDWIEIVFRVDPDQHNGSLEWLIVLAFAASTLLLLAAAVREWRLSDRFSAA